MSALNYLVELLELETLEINLFRGQSRNLGGRSVFGGQVIGQALVAAYRTVEVDLTAHSLHCYFLRPGDMAAPIVYDVERIRDGKSFTTRRVKAIQHGKAIFTLMASFQRQETGLEHQVPMPNVPGPDDLLSQHELRQSWIDDVPEKIRDRYLSPLPVEFKPVVPRNPFKPHILEPAQHIWFRAADKLPVDAIIHQCVVSYASDFNLLSTAMLPHGKSYMLPNMAVASLDHAIWFYQPMQADEWLLYSMDSPVAGRSRGLSRGSIFNQQGQLVAVVVQESLMRMLEPKP